MLFGDIFIPNETMMRVFIMDLQILKNDIGQKSGSVQLLNSFEIGIPATTVEEIASFFIIPVNELMNYLRISRSTWHRRKKAGKLDFNMSDKVFQVAKLIEYAEKVFGNTDKVRFWFTMPSVVFENRLPIELIGSLSGINLINEELMRIEYGVFI